VFGDSAQGYALAIAGVDLVAEGGAEESLIGGCQDQSFLLPSEIHHGLDLFLAGARVDGLKFDAVNGDGDGRACWQVGGFEVGVKVGLVTGGGVMDKNPILSWDSGG
jgi:hypothetical protein